jgi:CheY-like chemotaxis protein
MKVHAIDDYTVLGMNCSHCNISTGENISTAMLCLLHGGHLEQVTVSLLAPGRGPNQSILTVQMSPAHVPLTRARLIQPDGQETTLGPASQTTGFSKAEVAQLVGQQFEVFLLPGGSLLVIRPWFAGAEAGSRNKTATALLRLAPDDPRREVHGNALLLHPDETLEHGLPHVRGLSAEMLTLNAPPGNLTLLLLEGDQSLRAIMAEGLTGFGYQVIPAFTARHAARICQNHSGIIDLLLADVTALGNRPWDCLQVIQGPKSDLPVLLISTYDRQTLSARHGALVATHEFLPKPFTFSHLTQTIETLRQLQPTRRNLICRGQEPTENSAKHNGGKTTP